MTSFAPYHPGSDDSPWYFGHVPVPATLTPVYPKTSKVNRMVISNTSVSAQTLTVFDMSTNNAGQPCQIWPTVTIAANSVEVVKLEVMANGGVQWQASASGVLHAQIIGGCPDV